MSYSFCTFSTQTNNRHIQTPKRTQKKQGSPIQHSLNCNQVQVLQNGTQASTSRIQAKSTKSLLRHGRLDSESWLLRVHVNDVLPFHSVDVVCVFSFHFLQLLFKLGAFNFSEIFLLLELLQIRQLRACSERTLSLIQSQKPPQFDLISPELTMGQWVMGQMGEQIWVGHGSLHVTS